MQSTLRTRFAVGSTFIDVHQSFQALERKLDLLAQTIVGQNLASRFPRSSALAGE
jgi:hypothetical protein